jgi:hypothetical protein
MCHLLAVMDLTKSDESVNVVLYLFCTYVNLIPV